MKPTKNRIYCVDARRVKMLFDTEESANRFIEFNKESIWRNGHGKVPQRAYFCIACGGYHITSKRYIPNAESRVERYFKKKKTGTKVSKKNTTPTVPETPEGVWPYNTMLKRIAKSAVLGDLYTFIKRVDELQTHYKQASVKAIQICDMLMPIFSDVSITPESILNEVGKANPLYTEARKMLKLIQKHREKGVLIIKTEEN